MAYVNLSPWHSFLDRVHDAEQALDPREVLWYRGVTQEGHTLRPSLLRRSNGASKEKDLFNKYRGLATLVQDERRSDWHYLFDMQHYGLPTRLLDWTEVLGIAVFFATLGAGSSDSVLYILSPLALNAASSRDDIPFVDEPRASFDYREIYWHHRPVPPVYPIAIEAPAQNRRIAAQRGKFTIHGTDPRALEEQFPQHVKSVLLPPAVREGAREYLRISGINEFSVFPDIVGIGPFLEAVVGLAKP